MAENRWGNKGAFRFDENHGWLWEMESGPNIGSMDDACGIGTQQVYYLILEDGEVPAVPLYPRIVELPILQGQCTGIHASGIADQWLVVVEDIAPPPPPPAPPPDIEMAQEEGKQQYQAKRAPTSRK